MNNTLNVTWKYYDHLVQVGGYKAALNSGLAFEFWNPFSAKGTTYTPQYSGHFVARTQIFNDLKSGSFPQVSWGIPSFPISEHAPANITTGMNWVKLVIDSIMSSPFWNSTAIILTWDDYGGFYDHLPPPQINKYGLGFRMPALIISPYANQGYIDHTQYQFESTLKLIEWRFNLPSLTERDLQANNLLTHFDFNQKPLSPHIVPLTAAEFAAIRPHINLATTIDGNIYVKAFYNCNVLFRRIMSSDSYKPQHTWTWKAPMLRKVSAGFFAFCIRVSWLLSCPELC